MLAFIFYIKNMKNKTFPYFIHSILFISICLIIFYPISIYQLSPISQHQWRQIDSLSFFYTYFAFNLDFFDTKILNILQCEGRQVSDFPFNYYLAAKINQWLGIPYQENILRIIISFYLYISSLFLFKIGKLFFASVWSSLLFSFIIFTFPNLVYFGFTFIPEIPAFGLTIAAIYFVLKYYKDSNNKNALISSALFTFASLYRPSVFIPLTVVLIMIFFEVKNKSEKIKLLAIFSIPYIIDPIWIFYSKNINDCHFFSCFLTKPLPIWLKDEVPINELLKRIYNEWAATFQFKIFYIFILIGGLYLLIQRNHKSDKKIILFSFLGYLSFFILMFFMYYHHDYGFIPYLLFFILIIFLLLLKIKSNKIIGILGLLYISLGVMNSRNFIQNNRYHSSFIWDDFYENYIGIDYYMDTLNISRNDIIISLNDKSTQNSLYFAKRRGYNIFSHPEGESLNAIQFFKEKGATYIICKSEFTKKYTYINPDFCKKVGQYKDIAIFKMQ